MLAMKKGHGCNREQCGDEMVTRLIGNLPFLSGIYWYCVYTTLHTREEGQRQVQ